MNIELKNLPNKLLPLLGAVRRYLVMIFIVFFVGLYSFLVLRINTLASSEPSEDQVTEKLQTVKRPRIDQNAVDKMQQLEAQNIEVKTLFEQARKDPFNE